MYHLGGPEGLVCREHLEKHGGKLIFEGGCVALRGQASLSRYASQVVEYERQWITQGVKGACHRKSIAGTTLRVLVGPGYETREVLWNEGETNAVTVLSEVLPKSADVDFTYEVIQEVRKAEGVTSTRSDRTDRLAVTVHLNSLENTRKFLAAPLRVRGSVFHKSLAKEDKAQEVSRFLDVYVHPERCQIMNVVFPSSEACRAAVEKWPDVFISTRCGVIVNFALLATRMGQTTLHETQVEWYLQHLGVVAEVHTGLPPFPETLRDEVACMVTNILDSAFGTSTKNTFDVVSCDTWLHIRAATEEPIDFREAGRCLQTALELHVATVPRFESQLVCTIPVKEMTPTLVDYFNKECAAAARDERGKVTPLALDDLKKWYHVKVIGTTAQGTARLSCRVQKVLEVTTVRALPEVRDAQVGAAVEEAERRAMKMVSPEMKGILDGLRARGLAVWTRGRGTRLIHLAGPGVADAALLIEHALRNGAFPGMLSLPTLPRSVEELCRERGVEVRRVNHRYELHGWVDSLVEAKRAAKDHGRRVAGQEATCMSCLVQEEEMLQLTCGDWVCPECATRFLNWKTMTAGGTKGLFPIRCVTCEAAIPMHDIHEMLRYGVDESKLIDASVDHFVNEQQEVKRCANTKRCKMLVRAAEVCSRACHAAVERERGLAENQQSERFISSMYKPCPGCSTPVDKLENYCNAMDCPYCGTEFCWLCLTPCADAHAHFGEDGPCKGKVFEGVYDWL
eukprot:Sspe_Gene.44291::Locus_21699_Transcript_1_1_Confidence_1.000_Length_2493::g.44291::m.44291